MAYVAFAATEHRGVDGDRDRFVAGVLRPGEEVLHEGAILPDVDLEPQAGVTAGSGGGFAGSLGHLFDRLRTQRRQRVGQTLTRGGPDDGELARAVRHAGEAGRGEQEGEVQLPAEDTAPGVEGGDVAQDARAETVVGERGDVARGGALVFRGAIDVVEDAAREPASRERAEVVDAGHALEATGIAVEREAAETEDGAEGSQHDGMDSGSLGRGFRAFPSG